MNLPCYSQIQILDSSTNKPISYAHISSELGVLLATSDMNGLIDITKLESLSNHRLTIQHISYINLEISFDSLLEKKDIKLQPQITSLPEFSLTTSKVDYLVLQGYFRSYQIEDKNPKYFMDGIVEYYIPLHSKKKVKRRIVEYRIFKNTELIQKEKQRSAMMILDLVGSPYISRSIVMDRFNKNYLVKDTLGGTLIKKADIIVGSIEEDTLKKVKHLSLDVLAPKKEKSVKIFGYIQNMVKYTIVEDYNSEKNKFLQKDDLLRRSVNRKFYFKHKKESEFKKVEGITNFYVLGKEYISNNDIKVIDFSVTIKKTTSKYYTKYWENFTDDLPNNIKKILGDKLQLCE